MLSSDLHPHKAHLNRYQTEISGFHIAQDVCLHSHTVPVLTSIPLSKPVIFSGQLLIGEQFV